MPLLRRAGVRYRNPYQTRHTYAQVTLRRYACWIPDTNSKSGYKPQGQWDKVLDVPLQNDQMIA